MLLGIAVVLGSLVAGVIALAKGFFAFNNMMEGDVDNGETKSD